MLFQPTREHNSIISETCKKISLWHTSAVMHSLPKQIVTDDVIYNCEESLVAPMLIHRLIDDQLSTPGST